jgi:hypothetical protein
MLRRRLTGRLLSGGIVLVLAAVALLWLPASGSGGGARVSELKISRIHAVFSSPDRATTYDVTPIVSAGKVSYRWTLTLEAVDPTVDVDGLTFDADCNNHGVLSGTDPTFVWHHGNTGDPDHDDGCNHDLQGKYGHQGLITVAVTDIDGSRCETTYKGTFSSDAALDLGLDITTEPACTGPTSTPPPPPPPPPPSPPKLCKCIQLTARILPSSLGLEPEGRKTIGFTVHWLMTCLKGAGKTCRGTLTLDPSEVETPDGAKHKISVLGTGKVRCEGSCGGLVEGTKSFIIKADLKRKARYAVRRIPVVIERSCQGRKRNPVKLWIAFDKTGDIDKAKSKLR